jgi:hypothetical protein
VKWTNKHGNREYGDPGMHIILAKCLWENNEHTASVYHFAAGEAPEQFCQLLESSYGGYAVKLNFCWSSSHIRPCSEANIVKREQIFALCIMHFLALENLRDANELMTVYRRYQKNKGLHLCMFISE